MLSPILIFSFFLIVLFYFGTEGVVLLWNEEPDTTTYGQQGSNISMRWHYKTAESNETFFFSKLFQSLKGESHPLALRFQGENSYTKYHGNHSVPFSVSGKDNLTLTVYNADLSYNGKYCCMVTVKSNNKRLLQKEVCTNIFVYGKFFESVYILFQNLFILFYFISYVCYNCPNTMG
jgi:hypothetical protein